VTWRAAFFEYLFPCLVASFAQMQKKGIELVIGKTGKYRYLADQRTHMSGVNCNFPLTTIISTVL
jgi:hypothetical protein